MKHPEYAVMLAIYDTLRLNQIYVFSFYSPIKVNIYTKNEEPTVKFKLQILQLTEGGKLSSLKQGITE